MSLGGSVAHVDLLTPVKFSGNWIWTYFSVLLIGWWVVSPFITDPPVNIFDKLHRQTLFILERGSLGLFTFVVVVTLFSESTDFSNRRAATEWVKQAAQLLDRFLQENSR